MYDEHGNCVDGSGMAALVVFLEESRKRDGASETQLLLQQIERKYGNVESERIFDCNYFPARDLGSASGAAEIGQSQSGGRE